MAILLFAGLATVQGKIPFRTDVFRSSDEYLPVVKVQQIDKEDVLALVRRVNDYWQTAHPKHGNAFWHTSVYHTGNMAAYEVTGDDRYREYSEAWAEKNQWKGAQSENKNQWKYSYGETDEYVLFGDWQVCFQTYIDLYRLQPDERKIARAREVMEYQMSMPNSDFWWWADGLYMAMPVMTKLYKITGNEVYLQKLYEYFSYAKQLMYDNEAGLFYRDAKYIYPKHQTNSGKKDFWARGNGWVFAGLAKLLQDLPENDPHRDEYIQIYRSMAKALKISQQWKGYYWTRSLLDAAHAPGFETSGTALFTYGFLLGINRGLLDEREYKSVIYDSWDFLSRIAVQPDGTVGYVQPIGERADQHKNVNERSTADFGVGAFLLAASEMARLVGNEPQDYRCVWSEEFNYEGKPDSTIWSYEQGFVRNHELQWYRSENANVSNGILTITAQKELIPNPYYSKNSEDWRKNREFAEYTSACIKTRGSREFQYGRFEICAKIPVASGAWPAIWTLGTSMPWPSCGEIDVMEYYRIEDVPHILANTAWGTDQPGKAQWNTQTIPFSRLTDRDSAWADKFHIWRMDWDEETIRLYLDDELFNETLLENTQNGSIGNYTCPFRQPHYLLLNLAIGGAGGAPDDAAFPLKYEIDYVRVYQIFK